ncbi:MAG TPA: hypothetical protein VM939_14360 [Gemmatimonadaceae bacterium]|nr:hypothetical protein [Gemmatimonadaceae bacterium]
MRLEHIPVILGVLVSLIAAGLFYDAVSPEQTRPFRERRRRARADLNRAGEIFVATGTLCLGAALIANDTWRWRTIVVFLGVALLIVGAVLNRAYLKETLLFRGAARRGESDDSAPAKREDEPRMRIR